MAEVIGLVASLITVAGVGAKLANKLLKMGDRALVADHQLNRVACNITMFVSTLKHFAMVAKANEDVLSSEGREIATLLMEQIQGVFGDFTNMAVKIKESFPNADKSAGSARQKPTRKNLLKKVRAFFEAPQVNTLLAELEYLKSTFSLLIGTLTLAVTTARARRESIQNADQTMSAETSQRLKDERIHVETLIIARQINMNILIQKSADEVVRDTIPRSPTSSEDSFEEVKHPQRLLPAPDPRPQASISLLRLNNPCNDFLHRAFPDEKESNDIGDEPRAILTTPNNQIIDQLLGRWTRLNEIEINMQKPEEQKSQEKKSEQASREAPKEDRPATHSKRSAPELTLSKVESPEDILAKPQQEPQSLMPRAPLPPPPRNTANLRLSSVNSKLAPSPNLPLPLYRSMSTPGGEPSHVSVRAPSPKPTMTNAMTIPNHDYAMAQYQPGRSGPSPNISPRSSYSSHYPPTPPKKQRRNWRRPHVSASNSENGSESGESPDEEGRIGLGIPWTIKVGERYWDLLDGQIIGPRTPLLPTETLEDLYKAKNAKTEITTTWVSEDAMKEAKMQYRMFTMKDAFTPAEEKRFTVDRALRFTEVEKLVNRTIDMFEAYQKSLRSKAQPAQSVPQPTSRTRGPPSVIQTQGYGNVTPLYQSPIAQQPQTARGQEAAGAAWQQMGARRPQPQSPRQPSYHDQPPGNRPGTSGSAGSRPSADAHAERAVHFTESVQGGGSPRNNIQSKDNGRDKYEENNFYYNRRARDRAQNHDRDRHREQDRDDHADDDEHERHARERKKKASRTTKIGVGMLSLATLLETLDSVI